MKTVVLLLIPNIFMTFAWYGHLRYRSSALWLAILASWGIAFFEYCFQVPANRIGAAQFSTAQLKTMQEVITLVVFAVFSATYLGERLRWNHLAGFVCLVLAVVFLLTIDGIDMITNASDARFCLLGARFVGEETLYRFYVLYCIAIPFVAVILMAVHFWRVRKDGGISGPM